MPPLDELLASLRIAVVHDQLYTYGGAEKVLERILHCLPQADLFVLFDSIADAERGFLCNRPVKTTWLDRMPGIRRFHKLYFPLMPLAIEQIDLRKYDLVISSSYLVAKGVILGPDQLHICYLHSPMRYAWDQQNQYLRDLKIDRGIRGALARVMMHYVRLWDARSSDGVDLFIANSHYIARRARRAYNRGAVVLYPPVQIEDLAPGPPLRQRPELYVTVGRLVPFKRFDALVAAFNAMPERRLVVVGEGTDRRRLEKLAGPNVTIAGGLPRAEVAALLAQARAFMFAAEEDFGIAPVEAMACGTPVIALRRGGLRETVVEPGSETSPTGVFFAQPEPAAIAGAVNRFVETLEQFSPEAIRRYATGFSAERFDQEFIAVIKKAIRTWSDDLSMVGENPDGSSDYRAEMLEL